MLQLRFKAKRENSLGQIRDFVKEGAEAVTNTEGVTAAPTPSFPTPHWGRQTMPQEQQLGTSFDEPQG